MEQEHRDKLEQFMEIANISETDLATAVLASLDWDLEKALNEYHSQEEVLNNESHHIGPIDADVSNLNVDDSQRTTPSSGYSSRPSGSNVNLASNGVDSGSGSSSSLMYGSGDPHPPPRALPYAEVFNVPSFQIASDAFPYSFNGPNDFYDFYGEEDEDDEEEIDEEELEEEEIHHDIPRPGLVTSRNSRRPLIPDVWASVEEAVDQLTLTFETRYSVNHPMFHVGPLASAVHQAFEGPDINESRPLALYLHNDQAIASNIFAGTVLCDPQVVSLLSGQFITFAWDFTERGNKDMFLSWLYQLNMHEVSERIASVPTEHYPILVIVTSSKRQFVVQNLTHGHEPITNVISNLNQALSSHQEVIKEEKILEAQRLERAEFRKLQQEEYETGLAIDRARELQEALNRQKIEEESEMARKQVLEREARSGVFKLACKSEPASSEADIITIRIRLPCGESKIRRFRKSDPVIELTNFVGSEGFFSENHKMWNSNRPRENIFEFVQTHSFSDCNFPLREHVILEEIEDHSDVI